jgi:uncharacterized low-complexity protein
MASKSLKPVATALGAAFLASAVVPMASAETMNPFAAEDLRGGYDLANFADHEKGAEGKCGEGKCGEGKAEGEGKCGEGKAEGEGKCGEGKAEGEGKCGEGKCGEGKK